MQIVGHHLQCEALKRDRSDRDTFARSAYNRYYYALFLTTRKMLVGFDPDWGKCKHKHIPAKLRGDVRKPLTKFRKTAEKLNDTQSINAMKRGEAAAHALATLHDMAYKIRVTADYRPEVLVTFEGQKRFALDQMEITDAHQWKDDAGILVDKIKDAWAKAHV